MFYTFVGFICGCIVLNFIRTCVISYKIDKIYNEIRKLKKLREE